MYKGCFAGSFRRRAAVRPCDAATIYRRVFRQLPGFAGLAPVGTMKKQLSGQPLDLWRARIIIIESPPVQILSLVVYLRTLGGKSPQRA